MFWAYFFYAVTVIVLVISVVLWYRENDWGLFLLGFTIALCPLLVGFIIHVVVADSRQPAFTLKKAQWVCTASHTERETVLVGKMVTVQNVRVCDTYQRR